MNRQDSTGLFPISFSQFSALPPFLCLILTLSLSLFLLPIFLYFCCHLSITIGLTTPLRTIISSISTQPSSTCNFDWIEEKVPANAYWTNYKQHILFGQMAHGHSNWFQPSIVIAFDCLSNIHWAEAKLKFIVWRLAFTLAANVTVHPTTTNEDFSPI